MRRKERIIFTLWSLVLIMAILGCSTGETERAEDPAEEIDLTIEELSEYNGEEGMPAYIAVDGVIYDVSDSSLWKNGFHNGFQAGSDLTEAIKKDSPHGVGNLSRVPRIGNLID